MGSVYPEENCSEYMKENEILGPVIFFLFALKFLIVRNVCTNVHDKWITKIKKIYSLEYSFMLALILFIYKNYKNGKERNFKSLNLIFF